MPGHLLRQVQTWHPTQDTKYYDPSPSRKKDLHANEDLALQHRQGSSNSSTADAQQDLSRIAHDFAEEIQVELIAQMREQEALRRSEASYREFFENAKEAIYTHDLSGRYVMVNPAGEQLLGYSREELEE